MFYFRFTFLIFAIEFFLHKNDKLISYFSKGIIITILILSLDGLFQFVFGFNTLGFKIVNLDKLNGFFDDEAVLGSYLIRFLPLLLACFLYLFSGNKKYLLHILFLFVGVLIFLSGSRSSFALFIIFFLILLTLFSNYRKIILINFFILLSFFTIFLLKYDFTKFSQNQYHENKFKYKMYYNIIDPFKSIFFEKENTKV